MNIGLPLEHEFGEETGPEVGTFDAALELASMDTFMGGLARDTALDDMGGKILSPADLNEKYTDVQTPFNQPMSEVAAFHLNEEGKKRNALSRKIQEGPRGSTYNAAVNIGAGIVAHALDPVEFGVGAFTGMGLTAIGASVAKHAGVAAMLGSKGAMPLFEAANFLATKGGNKGLAGVAFDMAEGVIGNAALEPAMYAQQKRAQLDYSLEDAFVSVIGGGIAAPAAMFGIKKTWGGLFNKSNAATGLAVKTAVGQVQEGIRPDVSLVNKAHDNFIFNEPPKGVKLGEVRGDYRFQPVDVSKVSERSFFVAGIPEDKRVIGEFFGDGTYATDNPNFANNLAAHPMEDVHVDVREIRLSPEAKILDASLPNKEMLDSFVTSLEDGPLKSAIKDAQSLGEAWTKIRNRIDMDLTDADANRLLGAVKSAGYDGIAMSDDVHGHNTLHVFPESHAKMVEVGQFQPDSSAVPRMNETDLANVQSSLRTPENQLGFDMETHKATKDFILDESMKSKDVNALKADTEARLKSFEELAERGLLDEDSRKELEAIRESHQTVDERESLISDYADCLLNIGA